MGPDCAVILGLTTLAAAAAPAIAGAMRASCAALLSLTGLPHCVASSRCAAPDLLGVCAHFTHRTVISKLHIPNGTVAEAVAECCSRAQAAPTCTFWTFNHGTRYCNVKIQNPGKFTPDPEAGCTSGYGPAPLPPPGPAPPGPGPAPPSPAPPCPPAPPAPPLSKGAKNLLYIVVDDLRNELGFTNSRKGLVTPRMDELAKKGLVFDRAYVQQGVCSPSRNSFLSGRRPDTTKIWNFQKSFRTNLGDCVTSWPGAFKKAGYVSTGMGKVYHPGHPKHDDGALSWSLDWAPYYHPAGYSNAISTAPDSTFQDGMSTDVAIQRLQMLTANRTKQPPPFFMAVGLHKPHIPWIMPQRFLDQQLPLEQTDTATRDVPPENYCNASMYICDNIYRGLPWEPANLTDQQDHRRKYRAAVSWTDWNAGRLLDELQTQGLENDTAVIFHGDHGWHLGEQGGWCKQSNFDLVARVPMIVYVPWLPQSHGVRTSALVETVDLMPTMIDLFRIGDAVPDLPELEGTSFLPLLIRPTLAPDLWKNATFTQYPRCLSKSNGDLPWLYPSDNPCTTTSSGSFSAMGYSIRSDRWRYTIWVGWDGEKVGITSWNDIHGEELYDHAGDKGDDTDKFDNVNLGCGGAHQSVCALHKAALQMGWKAAVPKHGAYDKL